VLFRSDIITGYNIWGFDWEYIYKRAETGNGGQVAPYHDILYRKLQRLKPEHINSKKIELTIQDLSSSALGVNILKYIDIEGIVQIDLLKVVQRDHKLDSYKLDNVAKTFMNQQKVDLSPKELFKNFKEGSSEKIKEIAVYCIMDCKLVNELINKLQVITNNLGMSNVCVVPFSYLFLRGQGIKIFSLVAKFCRQEDFLIIHGSMDDIDKRAKLAATLNIFSYVLFVVLIFVIPRMKEFSIHPGNGGNPAFAKYDLDSNMRMVFYPAVIGWTLLGAWIATLKIRHKVLMEKKWFTNEK